MVEEVEKQWYLIRKGRIASFVLDTKALLVKRGEQKKYSNGKGS